MIYVKNWRKCTYFTGTSTTQSSLGPDVKQRATDNVTSKITSNEVKDILKNLIYKLAVSASCKRFPGLSECQKLRNWFNGGSYTGSSGFWDNPGSYSFTNRPESIPLPLNYIIRRCEDYRWKSFMRTSCRKTCNCKCKSENWTSCQHQIKFMCKSMEFACKA